MKSIPHVVWLPILVAITIACLHQAQKSRNPASKFLWRMYAVLCVIMFMALIALLLDGKNFIWSIMIAGLFAIVLFRGELKKALVLFLSFAKSQFSRFFQHMAKKLLSKRKSPAIITYLGKAADNDGIFKIEFQWPKTVQLDELRVESVSEEGQCWSTVKSIKNSDCPLVVKKKMGLASVLRIHTWPQVIPKLQQVVYYLYASDTMSRHVYFKKGQKFRLKFHLAGGKVYSKIYKLKK